MSVGYAGDSNDGFEMIRPARVPLPIGLLVVGTPVCVGVSARGARSRAVGVAVGAVGAAWIGLSNIPMNVNIHIQIITKINGNFLSKYCSIYASVSGVSIIFYIITQLKKRIH
jgi:hypothetical protein